MSHWEQSSFLTALWVWHPDLISINKLVNRLTRRRLDFSPLRTAWLSRVKALRSTEDTAARDLRRRTARPHRAWRDQTAPVASERAPVQVKVTVWFTPLDRHT